MTLNINGYEIEIKAKRTESGRNRFNKDDTMAFLCEVSSMAFDAKELREKINAPYIAKKAGRIANDIYDVLEAANYFSK